MNSSKKRKLLSVNDELDAKYGKENTASRKEFRQKAMAWYYGELLRERRKELNITQVELAKKTGLKSTYISRIERGNTDMQLSSFLRITEALGLEFSLV